VEWIAIERFMLALVFRDQAQNLLEHSPWDGDLGHLEGDIAAVADDLCADLDQLLFEARSRFSRGRSIKRWGPRATGLLKR
jgi:hypothetical protein